MPTSRYENFELDKLWKLYWKMRKLHPSGRRLILIRNELVKRNYGLVVRVAQDHYRKYFNTEVGEDLIAGGNLSLIGCIPDWEPERGTFSTFAYRRIWASMQRVIQREDNVPLYFRRYLKVETEVNPASSYKNVEACARDSGSPVSLLDDIHNRELRRTILAAMREMPWRESFVLGKRFFQGVSIQAVSKQMGICKENIQRIEIEARNRLSDKLRGEPAVMEYLESSTIAATE